jgi:hypothetical protein
MRQLAEPPQELEQRPEKQDWGSVKPNHQIMKKHATHEGAGGARVSLASFSTFSMSNKSSSGMSHLDSFVVVCKNHKLISIKVMQSVHYRNTFCHQKSTLSMVSASALAATLPFSWLGK